MFAPLRSKFSSVITISHLHLPITSKRWFFWRKKKVSPFMIVRAQPADHCAVLDLMWRYYYPEEPTTVALGLGHKHNPVFDDHIMKDLAEGLSYIARCKFSGDIVGVSINKTSCPWDPDVTDHLACSLSCSQTRQLFHFYAYLMKAPCLWDRYCTNKIFEVSQLAVKKSDRGKGVGLLLVQASRQLGADCGYRVVRVDATSHFTAKICDKLKMQLIHEIPYCSYTGKGSAREPIFKPPPPHCTCKIYIDTPFLDTS